MWEEPEDEFRAKDLFRKHQVPMDLFPNYFYDLMLMEKYVNFFEVDLPSKIWNLFGEKYEKFRDMKRDLASFVKDFKVETDTMKWIDFTTLRRLLDKKIIHGEFINLKEAEEGRCDMVKKWVPKMYKELCNFEERIKMMTQEEIGGT
jgi:hypothetical protein